MKQTSDRVIPRGNYQECLEHALTMAHLLEQVTMFLPMDSELWHRSGVELQQFSGWINHRLNMDQFRVEARTRRRGT